MLQLLIALLVPAGLVIFLVHQIRSRNLDRWLVPYFIQRFQRRGPKANEEIHLILCLADHFEPKFRKPSAEDARARVQDWVESYPRQFGVFRDSDGRNPRHTFFFPAEEYEPDLLDSLTALCALGFGEVEVHLHHDNDTSAGLRKTLLEFRDILADRHGLLARNRETGAVAYGFIHGNWALCNSRPDGRYCGVADEIRILRETGCYADLTMPSAPSPTQPPLVNSMYYAVDQPNCPRSHDTGVEVGKGPIPEEGLLLIQGPLLLDWGRRKWGIFPRLENGCVQHTQPPSFDRLARWLAARVQVPSRPDWFFVKLYCHGTITEDREVLLGEPMVEFHQALALERHRNPRFHYHYVTARELYNLVKAAESGYDGPVSGALDHELLPGPALESKRSVIEPSISGLPR